MSIDKPNPPGIPPAEYDEVEIMNRAKANPAQFAPLYETYFPRVYSYCARRTNSVQEAEDLTSIVFTRALRAVRSYKGGNVGAWLFRIAHNEVINYWRSEPNTVPLDESQWSLSAETTPMTESLEEQEQLQLLARLINQLPSDQQDLIALKLDGQLTSQEIGEIIGKSPSAVRVELHRTLKVLRVMFEREQSK